MNATTTKTSRRLRRALCSLATVTGLVSAAILASNGAAYGENPDRSPARAQTDTVTNGLWTDSSGQTTDASGNRLEGAAPTSDVAGTAADAETSSQDWSLLSPPGGDIFDVAVSTVDPKVVLAGFAPRGGENGGTLYRSDDNGGTWAEVPALHGISVNTIEFTANGTAYIGTQDGVFHSSDGGLNWVADPLRIGGNDQVLDLTVAPANPSVIWVGVSSAIGFQKINLMRSTDGGRTWTNRTPTAVAGVSGRAVAVDPTDPNTVIAGFDNGSVWVSTDGGATWADRSAGLPNGPVNDLVYDGARLLVGGGKVFNQMTFGLFESTDLGVSWTPLHDDTWPTPMVSHIAVDPNDPDTIFVATAATTGVHRSTDGGATWQTSIGGTDGLSGRSVRIAPGNSDEIFFSTDSRAVFRSTDGGATFVQSSNGIAEIDLHSVHVNPRNPKEIAIGFQATNSGGVFSTVDGGATWEVEPLPPTRYGVVRFAPDGTLYAISSGPSTVAPEGLYRRDADGSWTLLGPDQGPLFETDVKTVRFSPTDPDLILLGGADFFSAGTEATVWRSVDRGLTWTKAYEGAKSQETVFDLEIVADGTDQQVVGSVATTTMDSAVLRSEDGGRSWSASTIGLSGPQFGSAMPQLCTSAVDPHVVYLATSPALRVVNVFRSLDGGVTWRPTGWSQSAVIMDLACDPADGRAVYLLSNAEPRATRSQDAGATFSPFDEGIQGLRLPRSLAFVETSRLLLASSKGSYAWDLERDAITAAGSAHKEKGRPIADLSWDGATSTEVDVYRDGALVATVPNDGSYTETLAARGRGTVTYQVCRVDSSICSNEVTVRF